MELEVRVSKNQPFRQSDSGGTPLDHGQPTSGIGDTASLQILVHDPDPTTMAISASKGKVTATFTVYVTLSPSGPSIEQFKEQFINLVRSIDF
ncbi:hypothetical protein [Sinomonas sp. P47F7]|uniref:hypothetical protein n=1 Tax=Sinomonas sp. P47F7 TaxID=3410987 RepID=UPI003BF4CA1B